MKTMTPRERMMIALRSGQPDRIPAAPDISTMIPIRLTGKPFWEIEINGNPPLWKAYIDAAKYYGIDGWFIYGSLGYRTRTPLKVDTQVLTKTPERWEIRTTIHTPAGDLAKMTVSPRGDSCTDVEKLIKDFKEDFPKVKYLYQDIIGCDDALFQQQKKELGELGMMCVTIPAPGLHLFLVLFKGSLEAATYAYDDYPDLFAELCDIHGKHCLQQAEMAIDAGTDSILTGGSGSISCQSPSVWREMSLPVIKKIATMCKQAGVISGVHSCGKERYLVESLALETDLDYLNPLEIPPMGDCDLAELSERFGDKIALMGNLHTTTVMLQGSVTDVKRESLKAMLAAGKGGGFVLSTGDQCGRDTPDENIRVMVETAKEFGSYPLDLDRIADEVQRLENH